MIIPNNKHMNDMAASGLDLVGKRPPSAMNNKPSLGTNNNYESVSQPVRAEWSTHKHSSKQTYADRILGKQEPESVRSNTSFTLKQRNYTQQRCSTPKNKGKESYVDETLFGHAKDNCFDNTEEMWSIRKSEHNSTNLSKTNKTIGSHRPKTSDSRPSSVYAKRGYYKTTSFGSFVDETLFDQNDHVKSTTEDTEYDYYGNKIISKTALRSKGMTAGLGIRQELPISDWKIEGTGLQNSRPPSANSRPTSAQYVDRKVPFEEWMRQSRSQNCKKLPKTYQVFNDSYVDEALFGPKPLDADFEAPWNETENTKGKPYLFDSKDYSINLPGKTANYAIIREKGPYLKKPVVKNRDAKPVWK